MLSYRLSKIFIKFLLILIYIAVPFLCTNDDGPQANVTDAKEGTPLVTPLPMFSIDTDGTEIPYEPKVDGQMTVTLADSTLYVGRVGIEQRGASSQDIFEKQQYGFETRDAENEDLDVSLLSFREE